MRTMRGRVLVAALALVGVPALAAVATATPAQARCNGVGTYVTMVLRDTAGNPIAKEIWEPGTCNNNNAYTGYVEDSRTDDSCANLRIFDSYAGGYRDDVTECETLGRTRFAIGDTDGALWFELSGDGRVVSRNNFGF